MSKAIVLKRFPSRRVETRTIDTLRNIGLGMSRLEEELLLRRNREEAERRIRARDPPCVVCGSWSDDWLCPNCRGKFPWMHPDWRWI